MKKLVEGILCGVNIVNTLGLLATFVAMLIDGGMSDLHIKLIVFFMSAIVLVIGLIVLLYAVYGEPTEATKVISKYNR